MSRCLGLLLAACSLFVAACDSSIERTEPCAGSLEAQQSCLSEVGFVDVGDVELIAVHAERGIDSLTEFVLRGPARRIDEVLARAMFDVPLSPGPGTSQWASEPEVNALDDVSSGEDQWRSEGNGLIWHRHVIRGTPADGSEVVLLVWAFTT
jgi:hypothetical protein